MEKNTEPVTVPKPAPAIAEYTCPMHAEVVGARGDRCPKCKMLLEPKKLSAKSGSCCD